LSPITNGYLLSAIEYTVGSAHRREIDFVTVLAIFGICFYTLPLLFVLFNLITVASIASFIFYGKCVLKVVHINLVI
jgi:hypothetical protein